MSRAHGGKNGNTDWETPPELMGALEDEFGWGAFGGGFDLDPCATHSTKKATYHFGPDRHPDWCDGLAVTWNSPSVFVNPPYKPDLGAWVEKCYHEVECGHAELVVALLPLSGASWWHKWVMQATEIRFLTRRLRFVGAPGPAGFDCAVVIWRRGMLSCRWPRSWNIKEGELS